MEPLELLDRASFYAFALKRFDMAAETYKAYARLRPDDFSLYLYLFHAQVFNGDYRDAWRTFESRFALYEHGESYFDNFKESQMAKFELERLKLPRRWDGLCPLRDKTVLVWGEEGIGDILQFLRFLPLLNARNLIFATRYDGLKPLLDSLPFINRTATLEIPQYDYCLPLMSIPFLLNLAGDFPPPPYIASPPPAYIPGDKPKIGVCWAGDPSFFKDNARSVPLSRLRRLACLDATLVSLQKDKRLVDVDLPLYEPPLPDLLHTASVIAALDVVVSVDTCVAHLAAAMGKPVRLLLPQYPEWRWGFEQKVSPWYPNVYLCKTAAELLLYDYEQPRSASA